MKNTKEIQTILTAVYCINHSKQENKDKDIEQICEYAFDRILGCNTNLLAACCVGRTQEEILEEEEGARAQGEENIRGQPPRHTASHGERTKNGIQK